MPARNPTRKDLTAEFVRSILDYDPETGGFRWRRRTDIKNSRIRNTWNTRLAGRRAGSEAGRGYLQIRVNDRPYYAHRLAWLHVTGEWPALEIDHRDGDPSNNAFSNLRQATGAQNSANQRNHYDKAIPYKGVSRFQGRYRAAIQKNRKRYSLGYFDTPEAAHAAYVKAAKEMHGDFSKTE